MKNLTTPILFLAVLCGGIFPSVVLADVYFTRNAGSDATTNRTPGYWNHAAVDATPDPVTGRARVAEYQRDAGGLILVDAEDFFHRYPIIRRVENGLVYAGDGSDGTDYRAYPILRRKNNCTTFVSGLGDKRPAVPFLGGDRRIPDVYFHYLERPKPLKK